MYRTTLEQVKAYLESEIQSIYDNGHSASTQEELLGKINTLLAPPEGTPTTAHALAALLLQCPEETQVKVIANNYAYPFSISYGGEGDSEGQSYSAINLCVDELCSQEKG